MFFGFGDLYFLSDGLSFFLFLFPLVVSGNDIMTGFPPIFPFFHFSIF